MNVKIIAGIVVAAALLFAAYMFGVKTSAHKPEIITPVAAESLPSGAVVLERKPATKPSKPKKPSAKVERDVSVTVRPDQPECEPVTVDLQLVRDGEGRRVIASSTDGKVIAGMDMPAEQLGMPTSHQWAAGVSCDPGNCQKTPGIWVDRDFGRIRVGVEAIRQSDGTLNARVKAGWTW